MSATSTTSGSAVITNKSKNQSVTQILTSSAALCEQDAEWIVEDFEEGSSLVQFADFGTVTFSGAGAHTPNGTVGPANANRIEIYQNEILTETTGDDTSITVKYNSA